MRTGLSFLIAAKHCEIDDLQQLTLTSALVGVTGQLIHGLQRERGLSNLFLSSASGQFDTHRLKQIDHSRQLEAEFREGLDRLDTDPARFGNGARLFSRIAYVLQGLDALDELREGVGQRQWTADHIVTAYGRLISGLLGVVFEAADSASEPEISRLLVAMFNYMQAKEFAGQERAAGAGLFAAGRARLAGQQRLLHLIESQERCLQVFQEFAGEHIVAQAAVGEANLAELERLRRILCTTPDGSSLDTGHSQPWFDCCSRRMDGMKTVEDRLATELAQRCQRKVTAAQADLNGYQSLQARPGQTGSAMSFFSDPAPVSDATTVTAATTAGPASGLAAPAHGYGPHLERSILEVVLEQSRRLQAMGQELQTARASLQERKTIERAKGLLMAHRQLSEEEAHRTMRQMAMNQNRRLIDVAESVLSMAEVLPAQRH